MEISSKYVGGNMFQRKRRSKKQIRNEALSFINTEGDMNSCLLLRKTLVIYFFHLCRRQNHMRLRGSGKLTLLFYCLRVIDMCIVSC